jgi:16S rRNA (cytosine1402-N4)-methyltransferase
MVKQHFRRLSAEGEMAVLTRKVIRPSDQEIAANPRARSAKMRVAEKLMPGVAPAEKLAS